MSRVQKWIAGLTGAALLLSIAYLALPRIETEIKDVFTIGTAEAAGVADYTADGVADDVQFQAALNALPAAGGKISVLTGNYVFSATVTRAIANVTIEGNGLSTNFTYDGVNPIFTAGGNGWVFRNFLTDAGGLNMGATTGWSQVDVLLGANYYAYRTDRSNITASSWEIPTGRGATFVVAASDASAAEIAQADYITDGTADDVQIQAADTALPAYGGVVLLTGGTFNLSAGLTLSNNTTLVGTSSISTILNASGLAGGVNAVTVAGNTTVAKLTISGGSSGGIEVSNASGVKILDTRYLGINNPTNGWAPAIHLTGSGTSNVIIDGFYIFNSNRGIEVENGAHGVWVSNGYVDTVPAVGSSPLYSIGAHTHAGFGTTRDIYYDNIYITNSAGFGAYEGGAVNDSVLNIHFSNITIMSPDTVSLGSLLNTPYSSLTNSYIGGRDIDTGYDIQVGTTQGPVIIDNVVFDNIHGSWAVQQLAGTVIISNSTFRAAETANNAYYAIDTTDPSVLILDKVNILGNYDSYAISGRSALYMTNSIVDTDTVWFRATATGSKLFYNNLAGGVLNDGGAIVGRGNTGYVTENSGTATVLNAATTVVVTHGLATTPTRVQITPRENPTNPVTFWWVDTLTTTQFTIRVNADPGASGLDFDWRAVLGEGN